MQKHEQEHTLFLSFYEWKVIKAMLTMVINSGLNKIKNFNSSLLPNVYIVNYKNNVIHVSKLALLVDGQQVNRNSYLPDLITYLSQKTRTV